MTRKGYNLSFLFFIPPFPPRAFGVRVLVSDLPDVYFIRFSMDAITGVVNCPFKCKPKLAGLPTESG